MKKIFYTLLIILFLQISVFAQNYWEPTNGPSGGPIEALVINSNDDIFVSCWEKGISRSTDNGENWIQINNGLTNLLVWALAINSNDHIFAGTFGGEYFAY